MPAWCCPGASTEPPIPLISGEGLPGRKAGSAQEHRLGRQGADVLEGVAPEDLLTLGEEEPGENEGVANRTANEVALQEGPECRAPRPRPEELSQATTSQGEVTEQDEVGVGDGHGLRPQPPEECLSLLYAALLHEDDLGKVWVAVTHTAQVPDRLPGEESAPVTQEDEERRTPQQRPQASPLT